MSQHGTCVTGREAASLAAFFVSVLWFVSQLLPLHRSRDLAQEFTSRAGAEGEVQVL